MSSGFKKLNRSDSVKIPYPANKSWSIPSASYSSSLINILYGSSIYSGTFSPLSEFNSNGRYDRLVYKSANVIFYPEFLPSGSASFIAGTNMVFDNIPSTSSYIRPGNTNTIKYFPTESNSHIYVLSISKNIYGSKIVPGSFQLAINGGIITDDGNYNLFYSGSNVSSSINTLLTASSYVGNIFYEYGVSVLTVVPVVIEPVLPTSSLVRTFNPLINTIIFKNEYIIYENIIKCKVQEKEFNMTQNPSITVINSSGSLLGFATSSDFRPYITTVGLYNDSNILLAVAKLSQPTPISPSSDMVLLIKWDE